MDVGFVCMGLAGLHQCLFPKDHLLRFFLAKPTIEKDENRIDIAVEVMRWLGFANIMGCAFG